MTVRRQTLPAAAWLVFGLLGIALASGVVSLAAQKRETMRQDRAVAIALTGGDPDAGRATVMRLGCGACHEIPGLAQAQGQVGPSLDKIAIRATIAGGVLVNRPASMIAFLQHPEQVQAHGAMPSQPMSSAQARDIAAYLYTLR